MPPTDASRIKALATAAVGGRRRRSRSIPFADAARSVIDFPSNP